MKFENTTRKIVESECEDYYLGITDLSQAKNSVIKQFQSLVSEYPRAISVGITLPDKITYELKNKSKLIYQETNCQLKNITTRLNNLLENSGYKALILPKSKVEDENNTSLHAIVASLADLGRLEKGKLVTPEVGSYVNWATVLTDAPIKKR
jgi:epoxyqueuosine reductase QueG